MGVISVIRGLYQGKYKPLTEYLEMEADTAETMTFDKIQQVLGFPLPASAERHQAWWANQPRGQSLAWLRAGYRSSAVSTDERKLTFVRADQPEEPFEGRERESHGALQPLTIAEAKERLAQTFGVDPSQIEITVRA